MSVRPPRFCPRTLAPAGSLAGDLLRGGAEVRSLLPLADGSAHPGRPEPHDRSDPTGRRAGRPARLPASTLHPASETIAARLESILAGEGFLVTTGQQPVLFLGPLFVLYKAVTAIEVADRLQDRHGVPVLPLFWVASDDHDWPEVGGTHLLDVENRLREIRLRPPPGRDGRSVGRTEIPAGIEDLIDETSEILPSSEFVDDYLDLLRDEYRVGRPLGEAFGSTLSTLLGNSGLLWVDAGSTRLRSEASVFHRRVVEEDGAVRAALAEGRRLVEEAGHEPALRLREGGVPLFRDTPGGRRRLLRGSEGLRFGTEGDPLAEEEVLALLERDPGSFSPSAALRPVLESWLLPVGATVLGPGELAYWSQLPPLFEWAGAPVPNLRPRRSWAVVEEKVEKVLRKLDAEVGDFDDGGRALARGVTETGRPEEVQEALEETRATVGRALERLEAVVARSLPGIRSAVGAARHDLFADLSELERAIDGRVRERESVLLAQIEKAALHLFPEGRPQERVLNPLYYLARYGRAFLEGLREATAEALDEASEAAEDRRFAAGD